MITGIDRNLTKDYTSKFDSSEPKTIWKLGVLSAREFASVGEKISDPAKSIDGMIEVVRYGLKGFENFSDKNGKPLAQESGKLVSESVLNMIPVDVIIELGGKILEMTKLTEQEIKN